jgi:hypothetical protein
MLNFRKNDLFQAVGEKKPTSPGDREADSMGWGRTVACCLVAGVIQFLVGYLFYPIFPSQEVRGAARWGAG